LAGLGNIEDPQQCGHRVLERPVEGEEGSRHLGAYGSQVLAVVDAEITAQQLDQWEKRRGLAIGHRARFENPPRTREHVVGVDELVEEP
jgi:hypothetical protein